MLISLVRFIKSLKTFKELLSRLIYEVTPGGVHEHYTHYFQICQEKLDNLTN